VVAVDPGVCVKLLGLIVSFAQRCYTRMNNIATTKQCGMRRNDNAQQFREFINCRLKRSTPHM